MPRILVLDDEPLIVMMLQDWLTEKGFELVGPAHRLAFALELIKTERIDAAILDVLLGEHDCSPVAVALSEKGIPFIFLTGYGEDCVPLGFNTIPVATKPIDFVTLEAMLQKLLSG